jgi:hypothetical protein
MPGLHRTIALAGVLAPIVGSVPAGVSHAGDLGPGLSKTRTDMEVRAVHDRGPYIEAELDMSGKDFYAYALISEDCRSVFQPGETVTYVDSGPMGQMERAGLDCQILGVGNLVIWRDRTQRSTTALAPRSQASYELIAEDEEVALLRGSFPQAARLGFTGSSDLIAVVPVGGECERPIASDTASIEYRPKGKRALVLVGASGMCEIRGLIMPPPQAEPRTTQQTQPGGPTDASAQPLR